MQTNGTARQHRNLLHDETLEQALSARKIRTRARHQPRVVASSPLSVDCRLLEDDRQGLQRQLPCRLLQRDLELVLEVPKRRHGLHVDGLLGFVVLPAIIVLLGLSLLLDVLLLFPRNFIRMLP